MPYMRPLAQQVVDYLEAEGFDGAPTGARSRSPTTSRSAASRVTG